MLDRVRCLVSTATQPMWPPRVGLRGRPGTVVRVDWRAPTIRRPGYWWVTVEWELGSAYGAWPLRAEDLEPAEDCSRRPVSAATLAGEHAPEALHAPIRDQERPPEAGDP